MNEKVLIAIINNRKDVPMYFCQNLFELIEYTKYNKIKVDIRSFGSVEVQQMRNLACTFSVKSNFDYIFKYSSSQQWRVPI
jgi:phosphopantetheine adenylyltransferase